MELTLTIDEVDVLKEALADYADSMECDMGEFSGDSEKYQEAKAKRSIASAIWEKLG